MAHNTAVVFSDEPIANKQIIETLFANCKSVSVLPCDSQNYLANIHELLGTSSSTFKVKDVANWSAAMAPQMFAFCNDKTVCSLANVGWTEYVDKFSDAVNKAREADNYATLYDVET